LQVGRPFAARHDAIRCANAAGPDSP